MDGSRKTLNEVLRQALRLEASKEAARPSARLCMLRARVPLGLWLLEIESSSTG